MDIHLVDEEDKSDDVFAAANPPPAKRPATVSAKKAVQSPAKAPITPTKIASPPAKAKQTNMLSFFTKAPAAPSSTPTAEAASEQVFRPPSASNWSAPVESGLKASSLSHFTSLSAESPPQRAPAKAAASPRAASASKLTPIKKATVPLDDFNESGSENGAGSGSESDSGGEILEYRKKKRKIEKEQWKEKNKAKYQFLEDIMDENRRRPDDPDYDPRTLFVPPSAMINFTPFEKQYWDIKRKNWDTIVFFNKGKFYELFEVDAEIGHRVLGLNLTDRANMRMVGLPKTSYEPFAAKLIAQGYKVARVEQKETPLSRDKQQRTSKSIDDHKETMVLKRELDRIITPGTVVEEAFLPDHNPMYLLTIVENQAERSYGICLADTSRSEFTLGRLDDDLQRTLLKTLLLQTKPREIIYLRSELSKDTLQVIKQTLAHPPPQTPRRREEWWTAEELLDKFKYDKYFKPSLGNSSVTPEDWPAAVRALQSDNLVMLALGGCISYLQTAQLDEAQVSMGNFHIYDSHSAMRDEAKVDFLILDGKALSNLEILENEITRTKEGSLLELLDHCVTPFGKRKLRHWICRPLRRAAAIEDRLKAVAFLVQNQELIDALATELKPLCDLERLVSRCHSQRMSLPDFLRMLDGFETVRKFLYEQVPQLITAGVYEIESQLLCSLLTVDLEGTLPSAIPDFEVQLKLVFESFDMKTARESGKIQPATGVDAQYDLLRGKVDKIEAELNEHLEEQRRYFRTGKVVYTSVGKDLWVLEIPKDAATRYPPPTKGWVEKKGTKTVVRYWTQFIIERQRPLAEAREELALCEEHLLRHLLVRFDQSNSLWQQVIQRLSDLDCILSLARVSSGDGMCRPVLVDGDDGQVLDIVEGRHPCLANRMGSRFVPNDIKLSTSTGGLAMLLTGPNMGGKSTLLRQGCLSIIMAQLGCFVMAESMRFSPVDRIFTRIGASDNIFHGQSTFLVELLETASICNYATEKSLVILDELGRGTSTHDGYAIAFAVLDHLLRITKCRTMFSTHYHKLADEWNTAQIGLAVCHMAAIVNGVATSDSAFQQNGSSGNNMMEVDSSENDVIFLYKAHAGGCPRSYGLNVARLARLPEAVIGIAAQKSGQFYVETNRQISCVLFFWESIFILRFFQGLKLVIFLYRISKYLSSFQRFYSIATAVVDGDVDASDPSVLAKITSTRTI